VLPCYSQNLCVDPSDIDDASLPLNVQPDSLEAALSNFEEDLQVLGPEKINYYNHLRVLFRYRDRELVPLYKRIIEDTTIHNYFKLMAVSTLGEIQDSDGYQYLLNLWSAAKNNGLFREYIACAMGKLADSTHASALSGLAEKESNLYVVKTLEAAASQAMGRRRTRFSYLPACDTAGIRKLAYFPAELIRKERLRGIKRIDRDISQIPVTHDCIFPHMQYRLSDSLYQKVGYPPISFGFATIGWGLHVGEDSGWLFAGMPVHSIMDGLVVIIQHDESWGCLVCVESKLPNGQFITVYYGHLSHMLDVYLGQELRMGDKIGEIGPSFTFQNGGYLSHLHLGIEKSSSDKALVAGYHHEISHWHDPVAFITGFSRQHLNIY